MADSGEGRFAVLTEKEKEDGLASKTAKNTSIANKSAISVFQEYCKSRHGYTNSCVLNTLQEETLEHFYAEVRNKNGEKYSMQILRSLRSGIQR